MTLVPHQSQMSGHDRSMGLAPAAACRVQAPAIVTDDTQVTEWFLALSDNVLPVSTRRGFGLGIFPIRHPHVVLPLHTLRRRQGVERNRSALPIHRLFHSFQQHSVNAVQSYLAKLPHHPSSPFVGASFDDDDPTENSYGRVPHFKAELPQKRGELPHVCR